MVMIQDIAQNNYAFRKENKKDRNMVHYVDIQKQNTWFYCYLVWYGKLPCII